MCFPKDILYTDDHVWVKKEQEKVKVGITKYAQSDIGDILLVELPHAGKCVKRGEKFAVVETAKAIFDLKAPVSGTVAGVNFLLEKRPESIKADPYGDGWMISLDIDPSEGLDHLMNSEQYKAYLEKEGLYKPKKQ
jgi:glycine cleavage system H protein